MELIAHLVTARADPKRTTRGKTLRYNSLTLMHSP